MDTLIDNWKNTNRQEFLELQKHVVELTPVDKGALDEAAVTSNEKVVSCIDCLQCANCCKTTPTTFTQSDLRKASKFLGISSKEFIRKYLILDLDRNYTTMTTPCPFLEEDNRCKIYEVRPEACSSFPHTHRNNFKGRLNAHKNNIPICPITFHVVKSVLEKLNIK